MRLILPVSLERTLELEGRFPLLEEEWDRMIEILEAMRPALLESPAGRTLQPWYKNRYAIRAYEERIEGLEGYVRALEEAAAGDARQARALLDRLAAVEAENRELWPVRDELYRARIQIGELEAIRLGRLERIHELEAELESTRVELDVATGQVEPADSTEGLLEELSIRAGVILELREKVATLEGRIRELEAEREEPF